MSDIETLDRVLTAYLRGASFGPPEDRERHKRSAAAIRGVLEENKRLLFQRDAEWRKAEVARVGQEIAEAHIDAALALHQHDGADPGKRACRHCEKPWPCPTNEALMGKP